VALDAIRQLVFGSGIKIYPERYGTRQYAGRGIRATVERLYGIDLPDYAEDLRGDMMSVLEVQQALKKAGFDPGPLDGIWGKKTAGAVAAFQEREDIEESHVRDVTAAALRAFL
jgi:peptidoglycan hydrolase-like protein with peptidoglycan-binding domain